MPWVSLFLEASGWLQFQVWEPLTWITPNTFLFLIVSESDRWEGCNIGQLIDLEMPCVAPWKDTPDKPPPPPTLQMSIWKLQARYERIPILAICPLLSQEDTFYWDSPAQTSKIFSGSLCESDESRCQSPSKLYVSPVHRAKPIT